MGNENLLAPILDRLIDNEPELSHEPVPLRLLNLRQIKAMVVRDLENLLNTRRRINPPAPEYTWLNRSLMMYGLADFTSLSPKSPQIRKMIRQDIERTIALFEPRLKNVRVQIESDQRGHILRFRINAVLMVEPENEPVQFDTFFDLNRSEYLINK